MKNRICVLLAALFIVVSGSAFAQEAKYDYKSKSGKTLAPILDEGTTAVIKVDLKKADPEKIAGHILGFVEMLLPLVVEDEDMADNTLESAKSFAETTVDTAKEVIKKLTSQGKAEEFFIIFNEVDMPHIYSPVFLIPVGEKTKAETDEIRRAAGELEMKMTFVRHGFVWAIPSSQWNADEVWKYIGERFRTITPKPYPEIDEAFMALEAEENAAQLVIILPENVQDTFNEMMITEETLESMSRYSDEVTVEAMRKMIKPQEEFFKALTQGYRWGAFSVSLEKPALKVFVQMKDAKTATSLHKATKEMIAPIGEMLTAERGGLGMGFVMMSPIAVILVGDDVFEEIFPAPKDAGIIGLVDSTNAPAIAAKTKEHFAELKKARIEAMAKAKCRNNLKQLLIAFHNYHDSHNTMPPAYTCDDDGKPLHSWRVLILPYLEQQALYEQIKLDEPWDSEHNKQFHDKIPDVFFCPDRIAVEIAAGKKPVAGLCDYAVITGKDCFFDGSEERSFAALSDGTSNTLGIVERKTPVCWMAPEDIPQEEAEKGGNVSPKGIGGVHEGGVNVAFFDGSTRVLKNTVTKRALKAAITCAGGESISLDDTDDSEE